MGDFRDRGESLVEGDPARATSSPAPAPGSGPGSGSALDADTGVGSGPDGASPDSPVLPERLRRVRESMIEEGCLLAERFAALAPSFRDPEADGHDEDEAEAELLRVALALRCTRTVADRILRDAHRAVSHLPGMLRRLGSGEFPVTWFDRILRRTHQLTPGQLRTVDAAASQWPTHLTTEQFHGRRSRLLSRLESEQELPAHLTPEGRRRVELLPTRDDGIGCLRVVGPTPELLALAQRLDSAARAVQAAQRQALVTGEAPPVDPRSTVADTATPASLALIQYDLLSGAAFGTDGVRVPAPRFRLNLTVPSLTLLGVSQEPGMLEGTIPIPPQMARELAGSCSVWYRVLTDPATGEFLPLPAERYTPTRAMLEHLRLRNATCAVPGCTRSASWASECDHIEEYDHEHPERGGLTDIENLHLLCWQHHRAKTLGLIDPTRLPRTPGLPGRTSWSFDDRVNVMVCDDTDRASPAMTDVLMDSWTRYQAGLEARRKALERRKNPPPPPF